MKSDLKALLDKFTRDCKRGNVSSVLLAYMPKDTGIVKPLVHGDWQNEIVLQSKLEEAFKQLDKK